MKAFLFFISFFLTTTIFTQTWSDPVIIDPLLTEYPSNYPDFTIDNLGNIHCVFTVKHGTNFYRIYYSKSTDDGQTWSNPVSVSWNSESWYTYPQIASDNDNIIHLTYGHSIAGPNSSILYKQYDGENWSEADTLQKPGIPNVLTIDNNDRLYCFFGSTAYRYKEKDESTWSELINPYDSGFIYLKEVVCDNNNNLHCIGTYNDVNSSQSYIAYFSYMDGTWQDMVLISPLTIGGSNGIDMALDNEGNPHAIWIQNTPQVYPYLDSIMYIRKESTAWSEPQFLVAKSDQLAISIDPNNYPNVILTRVEDDAYLLMHYSFINGTWQQQVVEESSFGYYQPKLICKNNSIYLIQVVVDTVVYSLPYSNIVFRKMDLITENPGKIADKTEIFNISPNPFYDRINFTISNKEESAAQIKVYDMQGALIRSLSSGKINKGETKIQWDGTSSNGTPVKNGLYVAELQMSDIRAARLINKQSKN